jgi:hypothetical protein
VIIWYIYRDIHVTIDGYEMLVNLIPLELHDFDLIPLELHDFDLIPLQLHELVRDKIDCFAKTMAFGGIKEKGVAFQGKNKSHTILYNISNDY